MAKLCKFAGDPERDARGMWVEYADDLEFLVARVGSPAYNATLQRVLRPHRRKLKLQLDENDSTIDRCVQKAVAKHVVLDWRNLQDEDGKEIPYSFAKCFEILSDPNYRDLYEWIMEVAGDSAGFREADLEETAENSKGS